MIEYVADRYEDGKLVCFADGEGGAKGELSGFGAKRPEGERLTGGDPMTGDGLLTGGDQMTGGMRLMLPCPAIPRPEGRRVLLFEALGAAAYVFAPGAISAPDGKAALILPPDDAREAALRTRFEKIFKNRY